MIITEKTRLLQMYHVGVVASLMDVDIMKECERFPLPEKIQSIKPLDFHSLSFHNLCWLWEISTPDDMVNAICELFFYSQLKKKPDNLDTWIKGWLLKCPLIDFYRYVSEVGKQVESSANAFKELKMPLTAEEKAAGYGDADPLALKKILDSYARRQGIPDIEDAGNVAWPKIYFALKCDIDEAKKQRKYNEIITKKKR